MLFKYLGVCLVVFFAVSCSEADGGLSEQSKKEIVSYFNDMSLKVSVSESTNDDTLSYVFHFNKSKSDSLNSYFLGREANDLIISLFVSDFYSLFRGKSSNVRLTFEGYESDFFDYSLSPYLVDTYYKNHQETPLFKEFVKYAIKNFKYIGCVEADNLIRLLNDNLSFFSYDKSFFELLYEYAVECEKKVEEQDVNVLFLFCLLASSSEISEHGVLLSEKMGYYINAAEISENVLNMDAKEIALYLQSRKSNM